MRFFDAIAEQKGGLKCCFLCGDEFSGLWPLGDGLYMASCDHPACEEALEKANG
jgi:hypothetical protein